MEGKLSFSAMRTATWLDPSSMAIRPAKIISYGIVAIALDRASAADHSSIPSRVGSLTKMALSAPIARAPLMASAARVPPMLTTVTSPPNFSLSLIPSSMANSS